MLRAPVATRCKSFQIGINTKRKNQTKADGFARRGACFSLSAHRMGGEGRGEVVFLERGCGRRPSRSNVVMPRTHNNFGASLRIVVAAAGASHTAALRFAFVCFVCFVVQNSLATDFAVLKPAAFAHHVEHFNSMEDENVTNTISNADSWSWLQKEIPFFECPDREVEEMYYFRWWSFRKHLVQTPGGWVITEFLTPVKHAGIYNTVSCAAGFHIAEGRWLHSQNFLDDYTLFWLRGNEGKSQPHFHKFSSWFESAAYDRFLVNGDKAFLTNLLADFVADYRAWEIERQTTNGLFWQFDVRDGMEESISGSRKDKNIRPTINSYTFANALAIASIAWAAGDEKTAEKFGGKAEQIQKLVQKNLWNPDAKFFEVRREDGAFAGVREELGFIPWMFGLPDVAAGILPAVEPGFQPGGKGVESEGRVGYLNATNRLSGGPGGKMPPSTSGRMPDATAAWLQLTDPQGFRAPFGIATAERRHPQFRSHGFGTCEWDGAVWPFATSQTLYALANYLRDDVAATPRRSGVDATPPSRESNRAGAALSPSGDEASPLRRAYFDAFLTYVRSQHADGKPYIGEYLDEVTGDWINGKGGRSRYYNHSTFADLLITGVIGLRPRADDVVEVSPLLPPGTWNWFCLDGVQYHGRTLTIFWDQDGTRYGRGKGLVVLADGKEIARAEKLGQLKGNLP